MEKLHICRPCMNTLLGIMTKAVDRCEESDYYSGCPAMLRNAFLAFMSMKECADSGRHGGCLFCGTYPEGVGCPEGWRVGGDLKIDKLHLIELSEIHKFDALDRDTLALSKHSKCHHFVLNATSRMADDEVVKFEADKKDLALRIIKLQDARPTPLRECPACGMHHRPLRWRKIKRNNDNEKE